jgi:hypothetical protein
MGCAALGLGLGTTLVTGVIGGGASAGASTKSTLSHAKTRLLKLSDMPKGWTSAKNTNTKGGSFPGESQLASCIGVPLSTIKLNPPSVYSPEFANKGQTLMADESIAAFTSTAVARAQYAAISSPKTPSCYQQLANGPVKSQLQSAFGQGTTISNITVTSPSTPYAAGTSAFTLALTAVSSGITVPVKITEVFAIKGVEGGNLSLTSIGVSFPTAQAKRLSALMVRRL